MKITTTTKASPLAKAFAEAPSLDEEVEYRKLVIIEALLQFMKRNSISRTDLAACMDVVPARITKLLNGSENLTIKTLVRAGRAVGADLTQTFVPRGSVGHWVELGKPVSRARNTLAVNFAPHRHRGLPGPRGLSR